MTIRNFMGSFALLLGLSAAPAVGGLTESFLIRDGFSGVGGDAFGYSVAYDGETMAIGAPGVDSNKGAVYLYEQTGASVSLRKLLIPDDLVANDLFGFSVDVDGDTLVVGAPRNDDKGISAGAVYVYDLSADPVELVGKFYSWDEIAGEEFGTSVAVDGDTFMAGAPYNSAINIEEGAVTVYQYDAIAGWLPYTALRPKLGSDDALFGYDIDLDGNNVIIGAPGSEDMGGNVGRGVAYAYSFNPFTGGYAMSKLIESSSSQVGAFFGAAVGIKDDLLAVGAPYYNSDTGLVDIYVDVTGESLWSLFNTELPTDLSTADEFGYAIDVGESAVYVGAPFGTGLGPNTGCVHRMRYNNTAGQFEEVERFYSSELLGSAVGGFGFSVSALERQLFVGAPYENSNQGSALLYVTDRFWVNPAGGLWVNGSNWSSGSEPNLNSPVVFPVPAVYTVGFPSGQLREVQSVDILDGFVSIDFLSGKLTCNGQNGKGLIVASDGAATLQLSGGILEILSTGVVGDQAGSNGVLRLDQANAIFTDVLSVGEEGDGALSIFNTSLLQGERLTIGNNGGTGLVEAGPSDSLYFDPIDLFEYGVTINDGAMLLDGSYVEPGGEGMDIRSRGRLRGTGAVIGDVYNTGEVMVPPGPPASGSVELNLYSNMIMVREDSSGNLAKGMVETSWDGADQSSLQVSLNAQLAGLYRLDVPDVNTVSDGDMFTVLSANSILNDFELYLVPYVDENTYFKFSQGIRRGSTSIEGEVDELSIPFGFNASVTGPTFDGDARSIEPLDVDDDGDVDLVVLATGTEDGDAVCVILNENGTLCMDSMVSVSSGPVDLKSGDFDFDGDVDLAITAIDGDELQILENDGGGVFTVVATYATGDRPIALAVFDWNDDNYPDIALINQDDDTLYVYTNSSSLRSLSFGVPASTATSEDPVGISPGEIDNPGDKQDDIVVAGGSGEITYHHNTGGSWGATEEVDTGNNIGGLSVIDMDLDDIDDVLVTYPDTSEAGVHYGPSDDVSSIVVPIDSTSFSVVDIDDDGDDDIIGGGGGGAVGRGSIGLRVVRNDTESGSVVFMDVPAGSLGGLTALSTGMRVDSDTHPDLLTVLNDDDLTEFSIGVQTSINGSAWEPDDCDTGCSGDSDGSGVVDVSDLLNVIGDWGACGDGDCLGDINDDDDVNVSDLLLVIANWGSC